MSFFNSVTIEPIPSRVKRGTTVQNSQFFPKVVWHRVAIFRPRLSEAALNNVKKGAHVLVEGSLISSTYDQANGKGKKAKTNKRTFSCNRLRSWRRTMPSSAKPELAGPAILIFP